MTSSTAAIHVAKKQLGLDDDTYRANPTMRAQDFDYTQLSAALVQFGSKL